MKTSIGIGINELGGLFPAVLNNGSPLSITVPAAYFYLTSASPYDIGSTLVVADSEDAGGDYTLDITLTGGGTLTLSGTTGLTGSGDGTSSLSYSGTISAWNTALDGADIAGLSDETATMSITLTRDADSIDTSRNVTVNAYPALAITTLDPADDATGVQPDAVLVATFNRGIQAGTGNVVLKAVGGAAIETFDIAAGTGDQGGTIAVSGTDLIISPNVALTDATAHAIQIASTAVDGLFGASDSFAGIADDTTWSFTCEDTTPTLTSPLDSETGGTTATAAVTTDRGDGTLYWVVTTSATTPSHAQIVAGDDHTDTAAAASGSQAVSATGSQTVSSITGLTSETTYYTHFAQVSINGAEASPVSADGFFTDDVTAPTVASSVPADDATGVAVDSTIAITFSENVLFAYPGGGTLSLKLVGGATVETYTPSSTTAATGDNGGSVAIVSDVVTITPGADMAEEDEHCIRIAATCLEDTSGNAFAGIADDTTLSFTTAIADTYAILGFSPPVVADFENEVYRVGGTTSDFDTMFDLGTTTAYPTTNGTMVDSDGLLKWRPHNFAAYSEDFSNAYWPKTTGSVTPNATTDPDGGSTADLYVPAASSSAVHRIYKDLGSILHNTSNKSIHRIRVKAGGYNNIAILTVDVNNQIKAELDTGTITFEGVSVANSDITSLGDGWYLLEIELTNPANHRYFGVYVLPESATMVDGSLPTWTPDGTSGVYLWGAQSYRDDLGGMMVNPDRSDNYVPTTTAARYLHRRGNHVWNGSSWVNNGILLETEARTNLLLNSGTLSTQNVTTSATPYTLSFTGTGTVTLSGTSTAGPLVGTGTGENNRVNLTFTPTAGTLTLTVSGTVTNAQLEAGSTVSSHIPTVGATVTRAAEVLTIPGANMSYDATAMSFHMKGALTGIDDGNKFTNLFFRAVNDSNNFIQAYRRSDATGGTGSPMARQRTAGGAVYEVTAAADQIESGVNKTFNLAARFTNDELNVASNGTASTAETGPSSLATFTVGTELFVPGNSAGMGNITLFRQWDDDITDAGIEAAST